MNEEQAAEVSRLEEEAKVKAAKHVANMLQRPDQLEKVRNECVENIANDNALIIQGTSTDVARVS